MRLLRVFVVLLAGAGMGYGGFVASQSRGLSLQTVELVGASTGKVRLADVISAGRLNKGTSLLKLSTEQAARRIETLPWVSDARVERIFPSKIRVNVDEREPAFVVVSGPDLWLVDDEGVVLERSEAGLVRLLDLPLPSLRPGIRLEIPQFEHAALVVKSLSPALRSRLLRVRARSVDRITVELVDGGAVIYGAAEALTEKNYAARRLLEIYDGRGTPIESIDVRVPSRPAVKPKTRAPPDSAGLEASGA